LLTAFFKGQVKGQFQSFRKPWFGFRVAYPSARWCHFSCAFFAFCSKTTTQICTKLFIRFKRKHWL